MVNIPPFAPSAKTKIGLSAKGRLPAILQRDANIGTHCGEGWATRTQTGRANEKVACAVVTDVSLCSLFP